MLMCSQRRLAIVAAASCNVCDMVACRTSTRGSLAHASQHVPWPPRSNGPSHRRRCYTGRRDQVFFHASELQAPTPQQLPAGEADGATPVAPDHPTSQQGRGRPDLPSMVAPGTPVEFTVIEGDPQQKRRTVAVQVRLFAPRNQLMFQSHASECSGQPTTVPSSLACRLPRRS